MEVLNRVVKGKRSFGDLAMSGRGRGRGEYYKSKYGRGAGRGTGSPSQISPGTGNKKSPYDVGNNGGTSAELFSLLRLIDNKSYPAYRQIESYDRGWQYPHTSSGPFALYIGKAQADPYARPTQCRILVPASTAQFPTELWKDNKIRAVALSDYIHRAMWALCKDIGADRPSFSGGGWSGPKGGDLGIAQPTQHVLEQSAVSVHPETGDVTSQFTLNLPARGRSILGARAVDIVERILPIVVTKCLQYTSLDENAIQHHVLSVEDQTWVREELEGRGLVAFVADGAILPRVSGADDRPMMSDDYTVEKVVPFKSPDTLRVEFQLPNLKKKVVGMGIPKGVTLIVGGGFHGKSTLLSALQLGVYDKIPGDGREFCVCNPKAVKIKAEEGRYVASVDISSFISNLPFQKDTTSFTTNDASGSTSQASNIVEAIEVGAELLFIDEDTCATNFMNRDAKMIELVAPNKEPITPFVDKVRPLYENEGISSILVIGGCGDYFDVADHVIMMDCYKCVDMIEAAKKIATKHPRMRSVNESALNHGRAEFGNITHRCPVGQAYRTSQKVAVRSKSVITYGEVELDLSGLEQLVSIHQTNSISFALRQITSLSDDGQSTMLEVTTALMTLLDKHGLNVLTPGQFHGGLARPRVFEISGAVNRLRVTGNMSFKGSLF